MPSRKRGREVAAAAFQWMWRLIANHMEATWWLAWLLAALGWALWMVVIR
jgi:hypothetical protein